MARQISTREDISKILDELDLLSDPEDVLSESEEDFIPQGDVSESEDELTMQTNWWENTLVLDEPPNVLSDFSWVCLILEPWKCKLEQ